MNILVVLGMFLHEHAHHLLTRTETADKADGRARGYHRTAQGSESNAVGTANEQHPG